MGENMVKKIMTFKSGKFVFTRKFSDAALLPLLIEAQVLFKTVVDLPILPKMSAQLEEEIVRRSIFGTAALEGNPLTEEKVGEIISKPTRENTTERAEKEIRNLKLAYDRVAVANVEGPQLKVTEKRIKQIHATITSGIEGGHNVPGTYRNHTVKVGDREHGGTYTPPKCLADIEALMSEYEQWINSNEVFLLDPFIRAALAHYHLGLIHPFGDGNGRTARLVEALILRVAGIKYVPVMLSNFYYRNMDDYFLTFSNARKNKENDVTTFLEFALRGAVESLNEIKERITFFVRKFALRDYYDYLRQQRKITQRQHDFLIMLLDSYLGAFSLRDMHEVAPLMVLYRTVSRRTARRDLKKLQGLKLLEDADEGKHLLNLRALG